MIRLGLLVLTGLNALMAIAGGIGLLATDGLGMSQSVLATSIFDNFTVPGIILLVVVGGTQLLAFVGLLRRQRLAPELVTTAGFGLLIWVFTEMYIMPEAHWMQAMSFVFGSLEILLVLFWLRGTNQLAVPRS